VAEVPARALQALSSGGCNPGQFEELVNAELAQWSIPTIHVAPKCVEEMVSEFKRLLDRYGLLSDGENMQLDLSL